MGGSLASIAIQRCKKCGYLAGNVVNAIAGKAIAA
jgi:hypothetical protein